MYFNERLDNIKKNQIEEYRIKLSKKINDNVKLSENNKLKSFDRADDLINYLNESKMEQKL